MFAAPFGLAACSTDKPRPGVSGTATKGGPAPARVQGPGLPADLLDVMTTLYRGGTVPAERGVKAALSARKTVRGPVRLTGTTGTWKSSRIATVVHDKDVTLLVKDKRWTVVGGWWPSLKVARPAFRTMRVLAIGSDARNPQPVEKCRGDALHIVGVDAKGVGGIVGIPRDSWVAMPGGSTAKINAALVLGGARGQVAAVSQASGVPIDGYVITGFKGFRAMVSSLGGIVFVANRAIRSVEGFQIVKPGTNRLDAKHALALARERKHLSNGDFGRSANQGAIIKAGMVMAQKLGPARLASLLTRMSPYLATDLTVAEVLNLCASLYLSDAARVRNTVVPGSLATRDRQSVVLLGAAARSTFRDIRDGRLGT